MAGALGRDELEDLLTAVGVDEWGVAGDAASLPLAPPLPTALSLLKRFAPAELCGVEDGPHEVYYAGYRRLNAALDAAVTTVAAALRAAGHTAVGVQATVPEEQSETIVDWGDAGVFAHKSAATRAGLGWIGKTALFVSPRFGPRVRLATVFTDLALEPGVPVTVGRCGACRRCVEACPAGAGRDVAWRAGMPRDALYDEKACEAETDRYLHLGGVCGVCIAVCPWGRVA